MYVLVKHVFINQFSFKNRDFCLKSKHDRQAKYFIFKIECLGAALCCHPFF